MTTSGTYAFDPSGADLVVNAFAKCGVRRTEILQEHLQDARMEANLMLADWDNVGPNLWTVDLQEIDLVEGTATYDVPSETIMILDAYIRTGTVPAETDRVVWPISRTEYAGFPNKDQEGFPTVFWFDRLISPTVTMWQVPDGNGPYTLRYYRVRQVQDVNVVGTQTVEVPIRWIDAFAWGLAARLAVIYAVDRAPALDARAQTAWARAAAQDTEGTPLYIGAGLSNYYVR